MIDAHIHLDDKRFDENRAELITAANNAGITKFIVPAVKAKGFHKLKKLARQYDCIVPSYGLHPYFVAQHVQQDILKLDEWLANNNSCAVGECGLDFFNKDLDKDRQIHYFKNQIDIAKKYDLPLILHARGAIDAVFNLLKQGNYFNAMIHSFNGSIQQAKLLLDYGIKFSFGGAICSPNAHKLHKLVKYCPCDSLMFETDAPDQNLYPNHKEINLPINLLRIIECYALLTNQPVAQVKRHSTKTTQELFIEK